MDYEKLAKDLISECPEYCADCEYSEGVEFNCTIDRVAAGAITELFGKVERLEKENADLMKRAEKAERERAAAISDIESIMAYGGKLNTCNYCRNGQCYERGGTKPCLPKWYQEEE